MACQSRRKNSCEYVVEFQCLTLQMEQLFDVFALLSIWNVFLFVAFSFVLLVIVVWHTSKSFSSTDNMDLRFRSRAVGVQQGEPALMALLEPRPSCSLSVIIPAFKEATREPQSLKGTLLAAVEHLQEYALTDKQFSWEIIVVDDGSPDSTADSVIEWTNHLPCLNHIRVFSLPRNMGKGAAVKTGMYANACLPSEIT
jgi:cellulose synthase/poly-beta-1,6-N-acetylglucosamine synthase-like glycosyltransferase